MKKNNKNELECLRKILHLLLKIADRLSNNSSSWPWQQYISITLEEKGLTFNRKTKFQDILPFHILPATSPPQLHISTSLSCPRYPSCLELDLWLSISDLPYLKEDQTDPHYL